MKRVLLLDLKQDAALIAEYEAYHAPGHVPGAVVRNICGAGVRSMEIYRSGDRLVMLMDVEDNFDPDAKAAADANDPEVAAWETLMSRFQQPLPWAEPGDKWIDARRIFALDEHLD